MIELFILFSVPADVKPLSNARMLRKLYKFAWFYYSDLPIGVKIYENQFIIGWKKINQGNKFRINSLLDKWNS